MKNSEIPLSLFDLESWLKHPGWKWFQSFVAEQREKQMAELLNSDPTQNPWGISRAQGYIEAFSAIVDGINTSQGVVPFGQIMLQHLEESMQSNREVYDSLPV